MTSVEARWPAAPTSSAPGDEEVSRATQARSRRPRRVRVERGIYRTPTGGLEIQYTDSDGRLRWKCVPGGLRDARLARSEIQVRLGRGERVAPSNRSFAEV